MGVQIKRWRTERELTLANVAERSGLNVGYLSQIENDKASPSLGCLMAIADALEVPAAWFFVDDLPAPLVVRADERPVSESELGRVSHVDGRASRDISILEITSTGARGRVGLHSHAGEEHHLVLRGHFRMTQGEHDIEIGPGDYIRWDGTIPHDAEVRGDEPGTILIVSHRADR